MKRSIRGTIRRAFAESYPVALPEWAVKIEDTFSLVRWASPRDVVGILPHQLELILDKSDSSVNIAIDAFLLMLVLDLSDESLSELAAPAQRLELFSLVSDSQGFAIILFLCWATVQPFATSHEEEIYHAIGYWGKRSLRI